jgi:hypothetical protein
MIDKRFRENFDTGLIKIRYEIKSRLVPHGLHGSVIDTDLGPDDQVPTGSTIGIVVKGRTASRTFDRAEIESCHLRVGGTVLAGILSMVEELSAAPAVAAQPGGG